MTTYKGKNVISIISSVILAIVGIMIFILSEGSISNIIAIAFILLAAAGFANYYKYSIVLDKNELKITTLFKTKRIRYKDIIRIYTVYAGKTKVTYIVDKYDVKNKTYIRGTYPPQPIQQLKDVQFNDLSELISINSYSFSRYKDMLIEISKKVGLNCDIDEETWKIINS